MSFPFHTKETNTLTKCIAFQCCPVEKQLKSANIKYKALSLIFLRWRRGAFSFSRRRRIINVKMKNNELSNHSWETEPQAVLINANRANDRHGRQPFTIKQFPVGQLAGETPLWTVHVFSYFCNWLSEVRKDGLCGRNLYIQQHLKRFFGTHFSLIWKAVWWVPPSSCGWTVDYLALTTHFYFKTEKAPFHIFMKANDSVL